MASNDHNQSSDCPYVGSMGLHQNNFETNTENASRFGLSFLQFGNRSVIDVFRDMRDRYFGRPEINALVAAGISNTTDGSSYAEENDQETSGINSLPVYCKLMFLSFLDTSDICNVSSLNSHWRDVANDQILWRELLIRDMCKWDSMTNKSHPLLPQFWDQRSSAEIQAINFNTVFKEEYEDDVTSTTKGQIYIDKFQASSVLPPKNASKQKDIHTKDGINFKALYIHSSYQRQQDDCPTSASSQGMSGFIKSLWQGGVEEQGEIIMTGPGMDSPRTSQIFRLLMWGSGFMETKGLLPGNRDGIGSGVQVLFNEKVSFQLIALYSGNSRIRERRFGMDRLLNSNVVEPVGHPPNIVNDNNGINFHDNNIQMEFILHDAVRLYFAGRSERYKLVYIIDSTASLKWDDISCNKLELQAILKGTKIDPSPIVAQPQPELGNENNPNNDDNGVAESRALKLSNGAKRPLLILSCVAGPDVYRLSCAQVTAMLDLPSISDRPWRVQDVDVSTMDGVERGLQWLLRQT